MASATTPNIHSVNSSIDSVKLADGSPVGFSSAGGAKNVNFLSQLEHMMGAVKKEASALENMKLKLKDMDELKNKLNDTKTRLTAAETENQQLRRMVKDSDDQNVEIRNDMQRLNDIYYAERTKLTEAQQFNTRLEQEISGVKLEKEFFSKEAAKVPELKSALKTAKSQLSASKKNFDDEKQQVESRLAEITKKCSMLEKANEDSGRHLFNLTENLNASQHKITELEVEVATGSEKLQREKALRAVVHDRYIMSTEDLRLQITRLPAAVLNFEERIDALKSEVQKLKLHATGKTNELFLLTTESKKMQEKLESGATAYTTQISSLQETVRELNNKSNEIIKSNSHLKTKLQLKTTDFEALGKENSEVKALYKQLQLSAQQRDNESAQAIKGLTLQSEDFGFKLQSVSAQLEAVQQQTKSEQGKHWEEVKQLKDSESLLLEECDRLTQELQEKTLQLHTVQSTSSTTESSLRAEHSSAASMAATLKEELEKRLKDIVQLREERDALQSDKEDLSNAIEALRSDLSKNDGVFKRTLESDRSKMKQELLNRTQRIRALESEKQELLSETEQLVAQVTETRNEMTALQARFNDTLHSKDTLSEQYDVVRSHNSQLLNDIQSADRLQEELRATIERNNVVHSEGTERLEMLLRESKKSASMQVLEMSQHIKAMSADYDMLQLEHEKAQDNEKRALLDLERAKNEVNNLTLQHNDTVQQINNDNNNLRRELQDVRSKNKIVLENKTRVEMELVNVRNENGRFEMETHKQNIIIKEQESGLSSLQDSIAVLTGQLNNANEGANRHKNVISELEEGVQRKNATIEGLKEELVQLERDGLIEIRRLRVQLNSAENEISELRPMIPLLQKEASEAKNTLSSLKNNQSGAVNNLLEEVRKAEETLARERKKANAEVEGCHGRIVELQAQLEKTRELLDESNSKAKTDRSERDLRLMQLEGEAERAKAAAASKEGRLEELVQQHHADRVKMHELHEKCSTTETEMASLRSSLSHEQAARQRLEARLRSLMSTPDYAAESIGGGFLSARGHSSSGSRPAAGSSLLHSNTGGKGSSSYGGGSGVTNSMHRAGSSDAWEEDAFTDDHSVANTAHTNHSSHTVHSNSTMPYNRYDTNNNSNNNNSVRAQSPFNPSRYTNSEDFNSNNNTRPRDLSLQNLNSLSDRSHSDNSRSPPPHMLSPTREPSSSTRHAASPVVDRVGAALAAKAIPETSKNALKYAQQQRNNGTSGSSSRHSVGGSVNGTGGMAGSGSVGMLPLNIPASGSGMSNSHSSSSIMYSSNNDTNNNTNGNTRRPPSGNYNDRDYNDRDYANSILHTINDTNGASNASGGSSVEESIRRTQAMLNKRAAGTAGSTAPSESGKARTPNSGRSAASKLSESIQQASALYPPSPSNAQRFRSTSEEEEEGYGYHHTDHNSSSTTYASSLIDTPALRPISPPSHLSGNAKYGTAATYGSGAGGANINKDLEDEGSDESDTEHTSSVAPYGSNPNIHYVGTTAGSGSSGSGGKKKKSVKKGVSSSDEKYNGLQDALQLPKIASNGHAKDKRGAK